MAKEGPQIGTIRYNAQTEAFETLVTFYTDAGPMRVASSYAAPVTTESDQAARGLLADAMQQRSEHGALRSRMHVRRRSEPRPAPGVLRRLRRAIGWLDWRENRAA